MADALEFIASFEHKRRKFDNVCGAGATPQTLPMHLVDDMHFIVLDVVHRNSGPVKYKTSIYSHHGVFEEEVEHDLRRDESTTRDRLVALLAVARREKCEIVVYDAAHVLGLDMLPSSVFCVMQESRLRCGFQAKSKPPVGDLYQKVFGVSPAELTHSQMTAQLFVEGRARGWW